MMPLSILYESELKSLEDNRALLTSVLSDINISLHSIFNRNHCYLTVTNCFLKVFLTQTVLLCLVFICQACVVSCHLQEESVPQSLV